MDGYTISGRANTAFTGMGHIMACLEGTACQKILSDHTEFDGNWKQLALRGGQLFFAHLAARGVAAFAWVHGPNYHDLETMHLAQEMAVQPTIAIFDDVATAYHWLKHY